MIQGEEVMEKFNENTFKTLSTEELENCTGGIVPVLIYAGIYVGGAALSASVTIGIVKFCQWIKL
ncbi:MAG: hypothetical protein ACFWTQ_10245 [Lactococcus sp.]|jgi:lactobin A/cerein 7B family class IIb bacteriocin